MYTSEQLLEQLKLFRIRTGGLGSWITKETDPIVLERLGNIDGNPITKVQLNQLLAFGHEAHVSEDFFQYYWLRASASHPYDVRSVPYFEERWLETSAIVSLALLL